MYIPTTGSLIVDLALAAVMVISGIFLAVARGKRWGWAICAVALFWAYQLVQPFSR